MIKLNTSEELLTEPVTKKRKQMRPKVQLDWSDQDIEKLINAVQERPNIWDKRRPEYKLSHKNEWQDISNELLGNYDAGECKAKWTNLRVTFSTNLNSYRASNCTKVISWRFFKRMLFLEFADINQSEESTHFMDLQPSAVTDEEVLPDEQNSINTKPLSSTNYKKLVSLRTEYRDKSLKKIAAHALNAMSKKKDDEFGTFGDFVASELRRIPLQHARRIKKILTHQLTDLTENMGNVNPDSCVSDNGLASTECSSSLSAQLFPTPIESQPLVAPQESISPSPIFSSDSSNPLTSAVPLESSRQSEAHATSVPPPSSQQCKIKQESFLLRIEEEMTETNRILRNCYELDRELLEIMKRSS